MKNEKLTQDLLAQIEEMKANDVKVLDVSELTDITDTMIIVSGTSSRHVQAIANKVVEAMKKAGEAPNSVNGMEDSEWVLIDFVDVVVHVMQPAARELYKLEELWQATSFARSDEETEDQDHEIN